jgi:xanthine/CO dehydrogenase XdhC/CoxF family maturation factor
VETLLGPLLPLFDRERAANRALALAVVVHTAGSTYRKPGALMLIAHDGSYAGLLSGGCLETDLREHARAVIETGAPRTVTYDMGGTDDALWGLGVGCEGAMRILLMRVGPQSDWQPIEHLSRALARHVPASAAVVAESEVDRYPVGTVILPGGAALRPTAAVAEHSPDPERSSSLAIEVQELLDRAVATGKALWLNHATPSLRIFAVSLALPPRLLILGAGPDAQPVADFATRMDWKVTVYDHRPAYTQPAHFPGAERVVLGRAEEVAQHLKLAVYDAAVVMSHHLTSDLEYLRALASSPVEYVGLLGPAIRREKLLGDLSAPEAEALRGKLRAPVGLAIGGRSPESIALSIVSEVHAYLNGRKGGPFSAAVQSFGFPQPAAPPERSTA